jgi:DNA oxidative demethylase
MSASPCQRSMENAIDPRHLIAVLDPIEEDTQGLCFDLGLRFLAGRAIGHHAGQRLDLGDLAAILTAKRAYERPGGAMKVIAEYLQAEAQRALLAAVRAVIEAAPLYVPTMPRTGRPFSVWMTNCGPLGWVSDRSGYRYQPNHPETGEPWPAMPDMALRAWDDLGRYPHPPQACLINYYAPGARMGLHRDEDEEDFKAPVVSLSLGDSAVFRVGGATRRGPTRSLTLASGDALVLAGQSRLAYHGVDRVLAGTSDLLTGDPLFPEGGRINLTLRRVTKPG